MKHQIDGIAAKVVAQLEALETMTRDQKKVSKLWRNEEIALEQEHKGIRKEKGGGGGYITYLPIFLDKPSDFIECIVEFMALNGRKKVKKRTQM